MLAERDRLQWWVADGGDPTALLEDFLVAHGLPARDLSCPPDPARRHRARPGRDTTAGGGLAPGACGAAVYL
ncbi:MAG TPA: hypothetical protein VNV66_02305, partial [Pilimelia sp.]|nr:hypothetical protein [Pilimelia sp.]